MHYNNWNEGMGRLGAELNLLKTQVRKNSLNIAQIVTDELSINHLLYADDMAILSLSCDGLQNSLDKLKVCCNKLHLELNTTKTKIIVFNTTGRLLKGYRFSYTGKILEQVREFKYL